MPSNHGKSLWAQWSECKTTGLSRSGVRHRDELREVGWDSHAVSLGNGADVEGGSDGTGDGGLLFIICKAFSGKVSATALGDLKNDRRFDIPERAQVFTRSAL